MFDPSLWDGWPQFWTRVAITVVLAVACIFGCRSVDVGAEGDADC